MKHTVKQENENMLARDFSISTKHKGLTLIELMIVVVVVAILASVAYPMYTDQTRKTRRSTAHTALADAASQQEQFFLNNKTYTTSFGSTGLNFPTNTEGDYYTLSVDAPTAGCPIARCYVLRGTPPAGSPQASDPCGALTYNSDGVKTPANCW